jgi:hypothetical protein
MVETMASTSRTVEREEERRHTTRTLAVASVASATAALLTSQLWIAGTWIAAALTPVIVTLVSELLQRPTEKIARSFTSDRSALPAAGGAAPPARPEADPLPERAPEEPAGGAGLARPPVPGPGSEAPVRVYRSGREGPHDTLPGDGGRRPGTRRRKIAYRAVFATAGLAFVIAVAAVTLPELVAGGSVGKNDGRTTFFSGGRDSGADRERQEQAPQDTTRDEQQQPQPDERQQETPRPTDEEQQRTPTTEEPPPADEAPAQPTPAPGEPVPQQTTPAPPAPQQ